MNVKHMIVKYVRSKNKKRTPSGVLVVLRDPVNGYISRGWSLHRKDDTETFTKSKALEIAIDRAVNGTKDGMPFSVKRLIDPAFINRCTKYFKEEKIELF